MYCFSWNKTSKIYSTNNKAIKLRNALCDILWIIECSITKSIGMYVFYIVSCYLFVFVMHDMNSILINHVFVWGNSLWLFHACCVCLMVFPFKNIRTENIGNQYCYNISCKTNLINKFNMKTELNLQHQSNTIKLRSLETFLIKK